MDAVRRILLAEDDPRDVEFILQGLRAAGVAATDVDVAKDGQAALDMLLASAAAAGGVPALVLLDLKMPRMNGLDVLSEMRAAEAFSRVPVVMLTSSREASDVEAAYRLGANAYVVKPVAFRDFIEAVRVVAQFWTKLNEPPTACNPR
jgi:two-component system, response regulator